MTYYIVACILFIIGVPSGIFSIMCAMDYSRGYSSSPLLAIYSGIISAVCLLTGAILFYLTFI